MGSFCLIMAITLFCLIFLILVVLYNTKKYVCLGLFTNTDDLFKKESFKALEKRWLELDEENLLF